MYVYSQDEILVGFNHIMLQNRNYLNYYQIFKHFTHLRNYKGHCSLQTLGASPSWRLWVISAAIHPTTTPRITCVVWSIVCPALSPFDWM